VGSHVGIKRHLQPAVGVAIHPGGSGLAFFARGRRTETPLHLLFVQAHQTVDRRAPLRRSGGACLCDLHGTAHMSRSAMLRSLIAYRRLVGSTERIVGTTGDSRRGQQTERNEAIPFSCSEHHAVPLELLPFAGGRKIRAAGLSTMRTPGFSITDRSSFQTELTLAWKDERQLSAP